MPSLSTTNRAARGHALGSRSAHRVEQLQKMKSDGHGQYREVTDEKEVVRLSA